MTDDQIIALANAIRSISYGDMSGPVGLEMLSMAIIGPGAAGHDNLSAAIRDASSEIAEAMDDIQAGLHEIAKAIREAK